MNDNVKAVFNDKMEVVMLYPPKPDKPKQIVFWFKEKDKLRIDSRMFIELLNLLGFRLFTAGKDYLYVQIKDNIVEETYPYKMKECVRDYVMDPEREYEPDVTDEDIFGKVISQASTLFSSGILEFLDKLGDEFNQDTRDESFIYFRNCFIRITAEGYTSHKYEELGNYIWKKQIIDRDFIETKGRSDFDTFILRVCRNDTERYNSFRSVIGYLLHSYKDPAMAKAIILMDEKLDDGSNGGCGKSLLGNAISKVRTALRLGGKNFKFDRFSFQSYEPGTNIIEFNDLHKNFQFELLFTAITDNIAIEKKNKDEIIVPFEYSPKILLSTNYTIKGVDESTLRRQFIIEFSDYFNIKYSPEDEFGRRFFDDWCEEDWCRFYIFMIECIRYYLEKGLVDYERVNLEQKKLIDATSEEFIEFAEEIQPDTWYNKKDIYDNFIQTYPDYKNQLLQQKKFMNWIKFYAKLKSYRYTQKRSGTDRTFILKSIFGR